MTLARIANFLDHTIITSAVKQPGATVLDCGANQGEFAGWAIQTLGATVFSFEADPKLAKLLPVRAGLASFNLAIGGEDGQMVLRRAANHCSSGVFNTCADTEDTFHVTARSLESFCAEHGLDKIHLLKLDIEGSELDVLEKASPSFLAKVDQITCEFHDFLDPGQLPRIRAIMHRMQSLGFLVMRMSYWTYGDVLMLNRRVTSLNPGIRAQIIAHKYAAGIRRLAKRWLAYR